MPLGASAKAAAFTESGRGRHPRAVLRELRARRAARRTRHWPKLAAVWSTCRIACVALAVEVSIHHHRQEVSMNEKSQAKRRRYGVAGAASALLVLLTLPPALAGVVIQQEVTIPDAGGGTKKVTHTTMIDGNRLKLVSPQGGTIMDLDKGTFTILD